MTNLRMASLTAVLLTTILTTGPALVAQSGSPTTTVPRTVRFTGSFRPADGLPTQPTEGITLAVYADQTGGDPLWQETQNVNVDQAGNFAAEMGGTQNGGLPLDLLRTGEPRWVGVRVNRPGESEQPRVQLLSVPYALRASDAETLGGLPASAYLVNPSAPAAAASSSASSAVAIPSAIPGTSATANAVKPHITSGNTNYIGMFTNSTDLGNSAMFQNAGKIGLGTINPSDLFHVQFTNTIGTLTGYAVQNLGNTSTSFSGMLFYDQNGALGQFQGFNNVTHEYRINNIASGASINFMLGSASKFLVASTGNIGIRQTNPADALDVNGSFVRSVTGFRMNGSNLFSGVSNEASNQMVNIGINDGRSGTVNTPNLGGWFRVDAQFGSPLFQWYSKAPTTGTETQVMSLDDTGSLISIGNLSALNFKTSSNNTAAGQSALAANTGGSNSAFGGTALQANASGNNNTAVGFQAMIENVSGSSNTAVGNTALANSTGSNNTAIGQSAGGSITSGSNNIDIGSLVLGASGDSGVIRIGSSGTQSKFFAAGINGVTTGQSNAVAVVIDSNGQLGTVNSSRRFKEDIQDMGDASSKLLRLRPVTYRYKQPYADGSKPLDYGLIAEEVSEVYPDLVARNNDGEIQTVQYQRLTPMLLNELQKQNQTIQMLREEIRQQQEQNGNLESRLTALETLISGNASTKTLAAR